MKNTLQQFALEKPYRTISGAPIRHGRTIKGLTSEMLGMATYTSDPGEAAYNEIRGKTFDFLAKLKAPRNLEMDERSAALYNYRKAVKFNDNYAAKKAMRKYLEMGGTVENMAKSIERSKPLANLKPEELQLFFKELTPRERKKLEAAYDWWNNTFKKDYPLAKDLKKVVAEIKNERGNK